METIKDKIKELKSRGERYRQTDLETGQTISANYEGYSIASYNECLKIIEAELQDYTFIRVPRKMKMSGIIKRYKKTQEGGIRMNELTEKNNKCEHEFVFSYFTQQSHVTSSYGANYKRIEHYYCKRCLHQKSVVKEAYNNFYAGFPDWWERK